MSNIVTLIQEKIAAGYIIEAGTLLKLHADNIAGEKRNALQQAIAELQATAEKLVKQAEAEEKKGNIAEGLQLLHEAENIVVDLPDLQAMTSRMNDTVALTQALKNRSLRRTKPLAPREEPVGPGTRNIKTICLLTALVILSAWLIGKSFFSPSHKPEAIPQKNDVAKLHPKTQTTAPAAPQLKTTSAEQHIAKQPIEKVRKSNEVPLEKKTPVHTAVTNTQASNEATVSTTEKASVPDQAIIPLQQASLLSPPAKPLPDKTPPSNQPAPKDSARTYIIQPGDTLSSIAHRLFCNEQERGKLYLMNKDRLVSPSSIHPGVEIRLKTDTINIPNICQPKNQPKKEVRKKNTTLDLFPDE